MRIQTKFYIFITLSTIMASTVLVFGASYAIHDYTIANERRHGRIGAEIVKKEMLVQLMQNKISRDRLVTIMQEQIPDVRKIEIVRGPNVIRQFGDTNRPLSTDEQRALDEKTPIENYIESNDDVLFEYVTPLFAIHVPE